MSGKVIKRVIGWGLLIIFLCGVGFVAFQFYRTAPRPLPASEVIGHWVADPGGFGEGDFYEDGTFTLEGLSFNIVAGDYAVGDFKSSGTWSVRDGRNEIHLSLGSFSDSGDLEIEGSDYGITDSTLGWGSSRQLYFSDGEEINRFTMTRQSDEPRAR